MSLRHFLVRPFLVLVGLFVLGIGTVQARYEPVLVVTLNSIDTAMAKAEHLVSLAGFAPVAQMMKGTVSAFTTGIDANRPIAILVLVDDESFAAFGVVPVTNFQNWLKLSPVGAQAKDLGNDRYEFSLGMRSVIVQVDGDWAYLAQSEDDLENRPDDPVEFFNDMDTEYDFAVRGYIQNIPVAVRDRFFDGYKKMMKMVAQSQQSQDRPGMRFQQKNMQRQLQQMERLADDLDQFTLGLKVAPDLEKIIVETKAGVVPGSHMDRQFAMLNQVNTRFSGFFAPKATATMSMTYALLPEDTAEMSEQFDDYRAMALEFLDSDEFEGTEEMRDVFKALAQELFAIVKNSVQSGTVDSAASAMIADGKLNLIGATSVASGDQLKSLLTKLTEISGSAEFPFEVKMDVSDQDGITFHSMEWTLPDSKELANAFGPKLVVYLGSSQDQSYFGVGEKSLGAVRKAIANSAGPPKNVLPFRFLLSIGDVLDFAASVSGDENMQRVATAFREAGDNDQILASSRVISDGVMQTRLEVQEGVVSSIGKAYAKSAAGR